MKPKLRSLNSGPGPLLGGDIVEKDAGIARTFGVYFLPGRPKTVGLYPCQGVMPLSSRSNENHRVIQSHRDIEPVEHTAFRILESRHPSQGGHKGGEDLLFSRQFPLIVRRFLIGRAG